MPKTKSTRMATAFSILDENKTTSPLGLMAAMEAAGLPVSVKIARRYHSHWRKKQAPPVRATAARIAKREFQKNRPRSYSPLRATDWIDPWDPEFNPLQSPTIAQVILRRAEEEGLTVVTRHSQRPEVWEKSQELLQTRIPDSRLYSMFFAGLDQDGTTPDED